MSFQAYLDNIGAKTGKTPEDFKQLAEKRGLLKPGVKAGEIVAWLKQDFGLGHGHAMAIYAVFQQKKEAKPGIVESIDKHFTGGKSIWRKPFDGLMTKIKKFGDDIQIATTDSYLSLLRDNRKFAVIYMVSGRMDIGIKLKGHEPTERFKLAGDWNTMVTHRVQINEPKQLDSQVLQWLKEAYQKCGDKPMKK